METYILFHINSINRSNRSPLRSPNLAFYPSQCPELRTIFRIFWSRTLNRRMLTGFQKAMSELWQGHTQSSYLNLSPAWSRDFLDAWQCSVPAGFIGTTRKRLSYKAHSLHVASYPTNGIGCLPQYSMKISSWEAKDPSLPDRFSVARCYIQSLVTDSWLRRLL